MIHRVYLLTLLIGLATSSLASAQQPPWATLMPAKVQRQWFEDHRIFIEVTVVDPAAGDTTATTTTSTVATSDNFGNRIGNVVPFSIRVFLLEPQTAGERAVEVDFAALRRGQISALHDDDADWVLADKRVLPPGQAPIKVSDAPKAVLLQWGTSQYKAQLWEIKLYAQTFRRAQPLPFSVDFSFARELLPSGGLDWRAISTPEYLVSMSPTADKSTDLSTGNTKPVVHHKPVVLSMVLIAIGALLVVPCLLRSILPALRRRFARTQDLDPIERTWRVLAPIFEAAKVDDGYNLSVPQVRDVVRALKQCFEVESFTVAQLWEYRFNLDDGELLHSVIKPLEEGVLELGAPLTPQTYAKLVERIERLVGKPV